MPFHYDQEDVQRARDESVYRASLKPKVSEMERLPAAKVIDLAEPDSTRGFDDNVDMRDMHGQDS